MEEELICITYLEDEKGVKAIIVDGVEITGSLLVSVDGTRPSFCSALVGPDSAKPNPINLAMTVCLTKHSHERAVLR